MKKLTTISSLMLMALAASTEAQTTDPAASASPHQQSVTGAADSMPPAAPTSSSPAAGASPHQKAALGEKDSAGGAAFISQASQAGMAEVELSKLAVNKASDPQVKSFANDMIQDHTKANEELKGIAEKQGLPIAPALDMEHAAKVRQLSQKSGPAFDRAYVQQMSADHRQAIALFQRESNDSNSELAAFAAKTLPELQHHQQMVSALDKPKSDKSKS